MGVYLACTWAGAGLVGVGGARCFQVVPAFCTPGHHLPSALQALCPDTPAHLDTWATWYLGTWVPGHLCTCWLEGLDASSDLRPTGRITEEEDVPSGIVKTQTNIAGLPNWIFVLGK